MLTTLACKPLPDVSVTRLALEPLSVDESVALVEAASEDAPLSPHAALALARRSGGNPLFLGELVVAARSGGAVDELPDSAEALITARIDRLAPSERTLLRQASVLGAEFPAALLPKSLDGSSPPVDEDLVDRLDGFLWRRAGMAGSGASRRFCGGNSRAGRRGRPAGNPPCRGWRRGSSSTIGNASSAAAGRRARHGCPRRRPGRGRRRGSLPARRAGQRTAPSGRASGTHPAVSARTTPRPRRRNHDR